MKWLLATAFALVLAFPSVSSGANLFVQSKDAVACCSQASISITLDSSLGSGNLGALGVFSEDQTVTITSVTTTSCQSNTFTAAASNPKGPSAGTGQLWGYYAKNLTAGSCTITVNFSGSVGLLRLWFHEVQGADTAAPLDKDSGAYQLNAGLGTDAITSGTVTTAANGEYIFGFFASLGTANPSAGTNFAGNGKDVGSGSMSEYYIQGSSGPTAATFTQANEGIHSLSYVMTFKAAGGGGPAADFFKRRLYK